MKMFKALFAILALSYSLSSFALEEDDEMKFKDALQGGDVKTVQKYLKQEPALVNAKFFGWSPLQMAANANQVEVEKLLISNGADKDYVHPNAHHTAFMLGALNGFKETATYLAKAGADVNVKLKGDVSLIRYYRDEGVTEWVKFLTDLGVKDDGCQEEKCF